MERWRMTGEVYGAWEAVDAACAGESDGELRRRGVGCAEESHEGATGCGEAVVRTARDGCLRGGDGEEPGPSPGKPRVASKARLAYVVERRIGRGRGRRESWWTAAERRGGTEVAKPWGLLAASSR